MISSKGFGKMVIRQESEKIFIFDRYINKSEIYRYNCLILKNLKPSGSRTNFIKVSRFNNNSVQIGFSATEDFSKTIFEKKKGSFFFWVNEALKTPESYKPISLIFLKDVLNNKSKDIGKEYIESELFDDWDDIAFA